MKDLLQQGICENWLQQLHSSFTHDQKLFHQGDTYRGCSLFCSQPTMVQQIPISGALQMPKSAGYLTYEKFQQKLKEEHL